MRLAQHVLTANGMLLLSDGHILSEVNINRLLDLDTIIGEAYLWVADDGGITEPSTS